MYIFAATFAAILTASILLCCCSKTIFAHNKKSSHCPNVPKWPNGRRPRIAIIGGGIGGTVSAYELSNLAMENKMELEIDLYESDEIGGRLATAVVDGHHFETGGCIIHPRNLYMASYVEKFNLTKIVKKHAQLRMGLFNGRNFIFIDMNIMLWDMMMVWMMWGFQPLKIKNVFIKPLLEQFTRVYNLQNQEEVFYDVSSFLATLSPDFPPFIKNSIKTELLKRGISEKVLREFVFLATNINYNQNLDMHAFAGSVGLAAAEGGMWSVKGGNKRVAEELLASSGANLINKRVDAIVLTPDSKYALHVDNESHIYDSVIVACPQMANSFNNIQFEGFPTVINMPVKYQRTVVTLVNGTLNKTYFDNRSDLPEAIYSVSEDLFFNSISIIHPANQGDDEPSDITVYKVFSKNLLSDEQLSMLFEVRNTVKIIDWLAYPLYNSLDLNLSFVLHDKMFYVNAMEWAASAMEMSAISGRNAALLVMKSMRDINGNE